MTTSPVLVSARVQAINRNTFVYVPLLVLGGSSILTVLVWAVVRSAGAEITLFSGSVQAPFWYLLVVGAQTVALTFPFTQALSVSRRDFWLGANLNYAVFSAAFAVLIWILGIIEKLTGGWWVGGQMFAFPFKMEGGAQLPDAGSAWYLLFYFLFGMLALTAGSAFGTVYKRWGSMGLTASIIGIVAAVIVFGWLSVANDWWPTLQSAFPVDRMPLNITLIVAPLILLSMLISWALVRRLPA